MVSKPIVLITISISSMVHCCGHVTVRVDSAAAPELAALAIAVARHMRPDASRKLSRIKLLNVNFFGVKLASANLSQASTHQKDKRSAV